MATTKKKLRWKNHLGALYADIGEGMSLIVEKRFDGSWDGGFLGRRAPKGPFLTRRAAEHASVEMARAELSAALGRLPR